jgi:O-methyltransferase
VNSEIPAGGGALGSPGTDTDAELARVRKRYIDLTERALTHMLYRPMDIRWEENPETDDYVGDEDLRAAAAQELGKEGFNWGEIRDNGRDWPQFAQTMVGTKRLANVRRCVERVISDGVPGDLIETGVWRGGVAILMRAILEAYGVRDRVVVAADSFCGLPAPNEELYPADAGSRLHTARALSVSRKEVEINFKLYGLLDEQVQFLEGWFKDTLPGLRDRTFSVVRLDGDLYESTMDALVNLYPLLAVGGFLIVDDYTHEPCRQAVTEYRKAHGIDEPVQQIDWLGAFWRRAH